MYSIKLEGSGREMMIGPKNLRNREYKHFLLPNIRISSVPIYNTVDLTTQSRGSSVSRRCILYGQFLRDRMNPISRQSARGVCRLVSAESSSLSNTVRRQGLFIHDYSFSERSNIWIYGLQSSPTTRNPYCPLSSSSKIWSYRKTSI